MPDIYPTQKYFQLQHGRSDNQHFSADDQISGSVSDSLCCKLIKSCAPIGKQLYKWFTVNYITSLIQQKTWYVVYRERKQYFINIKHSQLSSTRTSQCAHCPLNYYIQNQAEIAVFNVAYELEEHKSTKRIKRPQATKRQLQSDGQRQNCFLCVKRKITNIIVQIAQEETNHQHHKLWTVLKRGMISLKDSPLNMFVYIQLFRF